MELKEEKLEGSVGGEGECGDELEVLLVRGIWSLEILSVKKLAKPSAREEPGVEVGNGEEDSRWSTLLTVCFELSENEGTKMVKYCFLEVRIGYEEIWKKTEMLHNRQKQTIDWYKHMTCLLFLHQLHIDWHNVL